MDELCGEKPWIVPLSVAGSHISDTSEETDESISSINNKKGKNTCNINIYVYITL